MPVHGQAFRHLRITAGQVVARMQEPWKVEDPAFCVRRNRHVPRGARLALLCLIDELREDRWRAPRRTRAAAVLATHPNRAVVQNIAVELDSLDEPLLADWLLMAKPNALPTVAAGVAVHALCHGGADIWDAIAEAKIADRPTMDEWWWRTPEGQKFVWSPTPQQLVNVR